MVDLASLQRWKAALIEARLSGVRTVRDHNGETVEYKSDSEMAKALAFVESKIALLSNQKQPKTFYVRTH